MSEVSVTALTIEVGDIKYGPIAGCSVTALALELNNLMYVLPPVSVTSLALEVDDPGLIPPPPPLYPPATKGIASAFALCDEYVANRYSVQTYSTSGTDWVGPILIDEVKSFRPVVIQAGVNDAIDFTEDGGPELTAYVAPGEYLTLASLASAVEDAMNAVGTGNYDGTYDESLNNLSIGITSEETPPVLEFSLLFDTGTNAATQAGVSLGFLPDDYPDAWIQSGESLEWDLDGKVAEHLEIMAFNRIVEVRFVYADGTVGSGCTVPRNGARTIDGPIKAFQFKAGPGTGSAIIELSAWWKDRL